jgi:hypothetical protein
MNILNIFINNGQLNWDAISTVSNIVLVASLVVITYWYAKKINEQTKEMIKNRDRGRILEEVKSFITPTKLRLESETNAIRENTVYWNRYNDKSYIRELSKHLPDKTDYGSPIFDATTKYPNLKTQLLSHDRIYDRLNELYGEIRNEIASPEFKERLRVLIEEYNERNSSNQLTGDRRDKSEMYYTTYIINKGIPGRTSDQRAAYLDFWDQYKVELLKFRNTPQVKELEKEKESILIQLKKLNEELLENIKEIIEKYRKEYGFTSYDIAPDPRFYL